MQFYFRFKVFVIYRESQQTKLQKYSPYFDSINTDD